MKLDVKLIVTAFAAAGSLQASQAALQGPLPEFKSKIDLQTSLSLRQVNQGASGAVIFYTGKPYERERSGYLFKYRSYDSALNRWGSTDPSGFPDGANNHIPSPTLNALDPDGLLTVTGLTTPNLASVSAEYGGHNYTVYARTATAFSGTALNGTLNISSYSAFNDGGQGGASININVTGVTAAPTGQNYGWAQYITDSHTNTSFWDIGSTPGTILYPGPSDSSYFIDAPTRPYAWAHTSWSAMLYYVSYNTTTNAITGMYGGIMWGFSIE